MKPPPTVVELLSVEVQVDEESFSPGVRCLAPVSAVDRSELGPGPAASAVLLGFLERAARCARDLGVKGSPV